MFEIRFRRRRSLRSLLLFVLGIFGLFACFSWYTLLCCRTGLYSEYVTNSYPLFSSKQDERHKDPQDQTSDNNYMPAKTNVLGRSSISKRQYPTAPTKKDNNERHSIFLNSTWRLWQANRPKQTTTLNNILPTTGVPNHLTTKTNEYYFPSSVDEPQLTTTSPTSSPQSLPPTLQLDQYVIRAWLPRGIKERAESNSYEVLQGVTEVSIPGKDSYPVTYTTPTSIHGIALPAKKRSVMISPPVKRLPQALIIGVKKCGTRALLEFLRVHPDVRASGPETHFFDRHYQRGLEWYRQQMPTSLEGQITMEKTPSYFITKEVPPRIHSMSPSVRLLVVVRDPVTRAISDYTQSTSKRKDTPSFEEMAFLNVTTGLVDTSWSAIRIGVYARFLEWWTRYFTLDRILFISGENLIKDPAGEMGRVQDFLDLKQVISDKHFYFNETKGFPCLKKSEGSGNPHCLGKTKGRAHPDISLATIQRLRDFYRPFNMKFYQMVGRNFGWP